MAGKMAFPQEGTLQLPVGDFDGDLGFKLRTQIDSTVEHASSQINGKTISGIRYAHWALADNRQLDNSGFQTSLFFEKDMVGQCVRCWVMLEHLYAGRKKAVSSSVPGIFTTLTHYPSVRVLVDNISSSNVQLQEELAIQDFNVIWKTIDHNITWEDLEPRPPSVPAPQKAPPQVTTRKGAEKGAQTLGEAVQACRQAMDELLAAIHVG
jgi:hypothetical protein